MRGVILAGGLGTRLMPMTHLLNKHLLPVWDKPMIHYPIDNMIKSGIKEMVIISNNPDAFMRALRKSNYKAEIHFGYQKGEDGIAAALKGAREFVGDNTCCVMLGDNIYQYRASVARRSFEEFMQFGNCDQGGLIVTRQANVAEELTRFGCAFSDYTGLKKIVEKPKIEVVEEAVTSGVSASIVTGTYFYTPDVFDVCDNLKPSARGEYEITDVNTHYLENGCLQEYATDGWWQDAGTFESLYQATTVVRNEGANIAELE